MSGPAAARLPDGRLHFQHGPIDLILEAFGPDAEVAAAQAQAWTAFRPVLDDLVAVLTLLRRPVTQLLGEPAPETGPAGRRSTQAATATARAALVAQEPPAPPSGPPPHLGRGMGRGGAAPDILHPDILHPVFPHPAFAQSSVADRMLRATAPFAPVFVTPMAAVAGAVADHVLAAMTAGRRLERAYVNNGGDAALWLAPGAALAAAGGPDLSTRIRVAAETPVRGIATSGWRGRSHSLGLADAVTVLARSAAEADAAATLIANAVDLPGHPAVSRRPARELAPDSDLGGRLVTVGVGALAPEEVARALAAGRAAAEAMLARGRIHGAALWLGSKVETVGPVLSARLPADA